MFFSLSLLAYLFQPSYSYGLTPGQFSAVADSPPELVNLGLGESLYLLWKPGKESLKWCKVQTPDNKTHVLPAAVEGNIGFWGPSMKEGNCGTRIKKVHVQHNGTWLLSAAGNSQTYTAKTVVNVLPTLTIVNRSVTVTEGSGSTHSCGSTYQEVLQCQVTSPTGKKTTTLGSCVIQISQANVYEHQGVWLCKFYVLNYISEFVASTTVNIVPDTKFVTGYTETETEYVIYCNHLKKMKYAKYCKINTPNGLEMFLAPGKGVNRYSYYGTSANECGVRVPKPLQPGERGSWRCELCSGSQPMKDRLGGYIAFEDKKIERKVDVGSGIYVVTETFPYNPSLKCHVNYSIEYCWFKGPTGKTYTVKHSETNFYFGDCELDFRNNYIINNASAGKWTCNIGIISSTVFELQGEIDVKYSEEYIFADKDNTEVSLGEPVSLGCERAGSSYSMEYCRFVSPQGLGLTMDEVRNSTEYELNEENYRRGHCSVTIKEVKQGHLGNWTCFIKPFSFDEISVSMTVRQIPGNSLGVYIGAGVGVVLLLAILGGGYMGYHKFKRRPESDDLSSPLVDEQPPSPPTFSHSPTSLRRRPIGQPPGDDNVTSWF